MQGVLTLDTILTTLDTLDRDGCDLSAALQNSTQNSTVSEAA
jgi:hypothetical protein